jgi:hypothetical protein
LVSRVPRLFFALYIVIMIRKADAGTQGKWHVWEGKLRLATVATHALLAIGIQMYIMLNEFCNLYLHSVNQDKCFKEYSLVMLSLITVHTIIDAVIQCLHGKIVLDFSQARASRTREPRWNHGPSQQLTWFNAKNSVKGSSESGKKFFKASLGWF